MLLEYCPNRTLSEHIDQYHGFKYLNYFNIQFYLGIPESNAIVFMKQLLLAVRYLHEDCFLLHRDIKPG
jgi:serine/threonine protein kinase